MEWLKPLILVALLTQNTSYTLLRRCLTMKQQKSFENGDRSGVVDSKEILLVGELIKLCVSVYMILTSTEASFFQGTGTNKLVQIAYNSGKMFVLAGIYLVMNILSFISLQYIGAGEFSVCAQLKILSTAGFSVLILGTTLSEAKWRALALLVIGCILVAITGFENQSSESRSIASDLLSPVLFLGYGAVLCEVLLSGFASIYFEKIVKSTTEIVSIWERNFQLSLYSIAIYSSMICYDHTSSPPSDAHPLPFPFSNWSLLPLLVAVLGSLGGLLVAASLKYADSILKTLATAGAIIVSTFLGYVFLDGPFSHDVVLGSLVTVIAILNYTKDQSPP
jgi:solute carrier family 35 (UDP-sugar transporter), member A1/2/3